MKILISLLLTFKCFAINCEKNPIYCLIIKNKSTINRSYAFKLSNEIYKVSKKYGIPKMVFTAIIAQESGYKLSAMSKITGLYQGKPTTIIVDFGLTQINWRNVERYGFDVDRLTSDMVYSLEAGAIILADFKRRYGKREKNFWSRYHASNNIRRSEYEKLVRRYL